VVDVEVSPSSVGAVVAVVLDDPVPSVPSTEVVVVDAPSAVVSAAPACVVETAKSAACA
jgi:hypothetical protein